MSAADDRPYVFDTGPLSHFAQAGWLGLLRALVGARQAWAPVPVLQEVAEGVEAYPHLRGVIEADWLTRRDVDSPAELEAFAKYASRLLGDDQHTNLGECGALALGDANGGIVVIDDGAARQVAAEYRVEVKTTVALLCDLVREGHLGLELASTVADDLLRTKFRLPFEEGGFRMFVIQNDFLPYS
ncbi:nucleotide-binding protein [Cellulomonas hominis]|uniref:nucleotide-binding protein n=1 Tax=Cellulomonas hominis TaxID=156981 RepID=UPI001C10BF97|nr:nucleotide-binding protein [Cellulomonas hominis]MBU5423445.1 nucleotide-binding protein [Cellulomonas hominis]